MYSLTRPPSPERPGLDLDLSLPAVAVASPDTRPTAARQAMPQHALTPQAHQWIAGIPPRYQPLATARCHAHVVNKLALLWASPADVSRYLTELLLSSRPGRAGFAFDVLTELSDLQDLVGPRPAGR